LGLPVFHIFEAVIKEQVDPGLYEEHVGFFELSFDTEAINDAMRRARGES
jgi:hypothetical protein